MTKIGMRKGGVAPGIFILTITGIYIVLMIPGSNLNRGHSNEKKLTKIGNLPYFGQFGPPHHYYAQGPYTLKRFSRS